MSDVRILYVINSMEGGGAASPLPAIMRALETAGAQVRLGALLRRNGKAIPPIERAGYHVHVRDGGEKDHFAAYRWIVAQAREIGATHVWTSLSRATLLGQLAGKRLGLPVVSWQHNAFLKLWNERLLRWNSGASRLWIADSEQVARLTEQRLDVAAADLVTWPIFFADPDAPQAAPWQNGETLRIGSLGRLHKAKGYDFLIDALAQLQAEGFVPPVPFQIAIAGEGGQEQALREQCERLGVTSVHFSGFTSDPRAFLAAQRLYLQPSRREGFCIAAHEAMQAGLPVLVSATGEMPHTVHDGEMGRVVPVGDVPALAAALRDLLSRPERLAALGAAARGRVLERYSQDRFDRIGAEIVERMRRMN
ncbi:glycosyltransferase [Qipengyuania oceanensis]|uniref:Glycosyltransferase n=1 Tax=Qipengyuania oceanensis TaxID=1463597 RepID=A0A844YEM4_9SPHN|nr:glycosyltransferase [Qipengyuania oceanensis]MXO61809.1 glycosyltransferase [Qipengyuania oceanensis]